MEAVPVDELAVAEREDLHRRSVAFDGDADHVNGPDRPLVGSLPLCEVPDTEQPVAVAGRILEALFRRRLLHLPLQLALDRPSLAGEELDHPLDDLPVLLL